MSYSVDTNVLVYASDAASPLQPKAVGFLEACAANTEVFCLTWPTIMGYLRIATHPSIFASPLDPQTAAANVAALLALPQVRVLSEQDGFWDAYADATVGVVVRGNLVPDAHLAALLRQHGVKTLYTNDSDFRKFRFIDVRNPFSPVR